ncbi:16S rRNA (cytosine(1402)-N(4))-methyltransferase, partial [Candidatus Azambacteria bacterium RBG_16_47_10]
MMNDTIHIPVLLHEIIDIFQPLPGQCFVDGTANGGGHAFALW